MTAGIPSLIVAISLHPYAKRSKRENYALAFDNHGFQAFEQTTLRPWSLHKTGGDPGPARMAVRVPNGSAWHPDWDSCIKMHECAAQRPILPSLTVPITPIGTLTPLAPWGPAGRTEPGRSLRTLVLDTYPANQIHQYTRPPRQSGRLASGAGAGGFMLRHRA
jgi:hypothetical protein